MACSCLPPSGGFRALRQRPFGALMVGMLEPGQNGVSPRLAANAARSQGHRISGQLAQERVVENEGKKSLASAHAFKTLLLMVSLLYGCLCAVNLSLGDPVWARATLYAIWVGSAAGGFALLRWRNLKWAIGWVGSGATTLISAHLWLSGGIVWPDGGAYLLMVVTAGLFGGLRLGASIGVLAALNVLAMYVAHASGALPDPVFAASHTRAALQELLIIALGLLAVKATLGKIAESSSAESLAMSRAQRMGESFETLFVKAYSPMALTEAKLRPGEQLRRGVAANEAFGKLFDVDEKVAVSIPGAQIALWPDKTQLLALRDVLSETGSVEAMKCDMCTYDGKKSLSCLVSAVPVEWEGTAAVLWTFQDVTENERLRSDLEQANRQQAQRVETKAKELAFVQKSLARQDSLVRLGEMVSAVAHEINTPLGNALLATTSVSDLAVKLSDYASGQAISRGELKKMSERLAEATSISVENLSKASDTIKGFKQFSADQAGHVRRRYKIEEPLEASFKMMKPRLELQTVSWSLEVDPEVKAIELDGHPGSVTQAMNILVSNSLMHAFAGKPGSWEIKARAKPSPQGILIQFWDNGSGIDGEAAQRLFEPYFTTKAGEGGTGLGLPIARGLIETDLGGSLALAASGPGQGALFEIDLPLCAPAST